MKSEEPARRRGLASQYTAGLRGLPVRLPVVKPDRTHIFYRYVIGVDDPAIRPYVAARQPIA